MAEKQPKSDDKTKPVSTRLTSLGRPRDLHLAGPSTSKPKKVFTPNLNAVRNKGKAAPNLPTDTGKRNVKKQSKDFKKRDPDASRFVQSTGIFSEGTTEVKRESTYHSRASDAREGGGEAAAGMEKPKIDTDAIWNVDMQEEGKVISDLLDYGANSEEATDGDVYQPVVLPLSKNKENFFKTFAPQPPQDAKVKQEALGKDPNADVEDVTENLTQCSFNTPNLFSDSNVTFSIVKLPDSMPGKGFDEEGKVVDYTLEQMNEGKIGRIVKRRSGKMEIIIGDMKYDLNSVGAAPFMEQLMVLPEPGASEEDATMVDLGAVNESFTFSPSWRSLLSQKPDA